MSAPKTKLTELYPDEPDSDDDLRVDLKSRSTISSQNIKTKVAPESVNYDNSEADFQAPDPSINDFSAKLEAYKYKKKDNLRESLDDFAESKQFTAPSSPYFTPSTKFSGVEKQLDASAIQSPQITTPTPKKQALKITPVEDTKPKQVGHKIALTEHKMETTPTPPTKAVSQPVRVHSSASPGNSFSSSDLDYFFPLYSTPPKFQATQINSNVQISSSPPIKSALPPQCNTHTPNFSVNKENNPVGANVNIQTSNSLPNGSLSKSNTLHSSTLPTPAPAKVSAYFQPSLKQTQPPSVPISQKLNATIPTPRSITQPSQPKVTTAAPTSPIDSPQIVLHCQVK